MQVVLYLFAGIGLAFTILFIAMLVKRWRSFKNEKKTRG